MSCTWSKGTCDFDLTFRFTTFKIKFLFSVAAAYYNDIQLVSLLYYDKKG